MSKTTKDQRRIVRLAKYSKDPQNRSIKQELNFEALDTIVTVQKKFRLGKLQILQGEQVRLSCIDQHWSRQALEFHADVGGVVV